MGKWNVYDVDTHVHLHVTGPGVRPGLVLPVVTSHVDFAPTWLGLAGIKTPSDTMDGRSFVSALVDPTDPLVPPSVLRHIHEEEAQLLSSTNRSNGTAYIEYHGLQDFVGDAYRRMDSLNNTYRGVRVITGDNEAEIRIDAEGNVVGNYLFAEFGGDYLFKVSTFTTLRRQLQGLCLPLGVFFTSAILQTVVFEELYNCNNDPWQMHNIVNATDPVILNKLRSTVHNLWQCGGDNCR